MTNRLFISGFIALFSLSCSAQQDDSFEDFRNRLHQDFAGFRQQVHDDYEEFRDKINAEYAEWLRTIWRDCNASPVVPKPQDDKVPPVVIKDEDKDKEIEDNLVVIEEEIPMPEPTPQPTPIAPIREVPSPVEPKMSFSIYGTSMEVRAGDKLRFTLNNVQPNNLAAAWLRLSESDYDNLIFDCMELREKHNLCDWSYLRMLDAMSGRLLGKGSNEAEMLKAYIFCQSGYQMRLATAGDRLYMLYGSQFHIFDKPCWDVDGVLFYADDITVDRISICNAEFPHEQAMSLAVNTEQTFAARPSRERSIASNDVAWMKATVIEDENLMTFCNNCPTSYFGNDIMTRWALYANMPMSRMAKNRLHAQLRPWIEGRNNAEAVDILCHWIQTAFVYELDDKVWGHDRAFFADETLYYPYCDCEDRSILLTRLVRDLLGLKCALVYYPGHLATAIAVGEDVKGDYIRIDGTKFLICDPTYIGAPIGVTMPDMDNKTAKVIVL